ncbi:putative inorganic polyphosphate/ATP-NAD kinase, putative,poly(p)/ATP NAD kinase [Trypanosoma grayi]|uniref:putative inorganic polyphosphate/ATP-NAD kinase, putative,poly(p)/ATP NAD kinase n=1 Tax=Trypanosoma grayi TaxID=71804 RepID=UPI0004F46415|nr:putative inorganic polyphosphate/ATP-NAD kinase, putative,poly(p)/ATP NAD kinase [Trypanosoma grayi]KEG10351.1 putative inorganic polyphosphate/ATP-NAD kinase, putative,poly(p)/ATP NAD kinase [Trypanosoma grayi]
MLRRVSLLCCYSVPPLSRVGIFPLHLDPPTVQHREIFRLLIGDTSSDTGSGGSSSPAPGSLWCLEPLAESLKSSERVPFDYLILVPNTRFPVALRLSTHLAALTKLATRGLPRVCVDFTALEHPDEDMPCVYELTQKYKNSTLVHWLQDAHEMQKWTHFSDVKLRVPMLLLQTVSFPASMVGKPRDPRIIGRTNSSSSWGSISSSSGGLPSASDAVPQKEQQQKRDATGSTLFDIFDSREGRKRSQCWVAEGRGEEEVEISRSYKRSATASWLESPDTSLVLDPVGAGNTLGSSSNSNGKNQSGNTGNSSIDNNSIRGAASHESYSVACDGRLLSTSSTDGAGDEASNDTMPARRNVRQLVEELFSTLHHVEGLYDRTALHKPLPHVEVHSVHRSTGADVRHALWEREVDPMLLLTEPVYRYVSSHGLYHDYRKDAYPKMAHATHSVVTGSSGSSSSTWRKGKMPSSGFSATLSFSGLIPRLELHYDKNNLLAREYYEKLSAFQAGRDEEPDLIVPIGGDGYMMHCIRNNWNRFIPFFGVNAGHVGYLLNDASTLEELFAAPLKLHTTTMLYCLAEKETQTGEKVLLSELAFNDAWVERSTGQTALIRILVNGEERIRQLRGDGVLVSTAAGSTAYCQALGASPVPVGAPLIQVVGSNVVSPAQWRPAHLNQEDQVELEVIDSFKRPCRCFVDSVDVGNVTRMLVRSSRAAGVVIAFAGSCDLQQKLYQMQFPKTF